MNEQQKNKWIKAGWLLFYLYIILLSYFLFFSERYVSADYRYNLEFLKEIRRFIKYRELIGLKSFVINIMGNILAFAPFGFMLPLLNKRFNHFFKVLFLSLFFSLSIELVQLSFKVGIFDVDDVLLNTLGGITGYIAFAIYDCFIRMRSRKRKRRD